MLTALQKEQLVIKKVQELFKEAELPLNEWSSEHQKLFDANIGIIISSVHTMKKSPEEELEM